MHWHVFHRPFGQRRKCQRANVLLRCFTRSMRQGEPPIVSGGINKLTHVQSNMHKLNDFAQLATRLVNSHCTYADLLSLFRIIESLPLAKLYWLIIDFFFHKNIGLSFLIQFDILIFQIETALTLCLTLLDQLT